MPTYSYTETADQDDLIDQVKRKAEQVTAVGQTIAVNQLLAYQSLVHAMRQILHKADLDMVQVEATDGTSDANSNGTDETGFYKIPLPDGYLRFDRVRLAAWKRSVDDLTSRHSNLYVQQGNPYTAADAYNPLASKVQGAIECYPTDTSGTPVDEFWFIGEKAPEDLGDNIIKDAVVWYATHVLLQVEREYNPSEQALAQAQQTLEGNLYGYKGEELPQVE